MTTLAQYERARAALAEATRIDEVLPLIDEFELVKVRAKQIKDQTLLAEATEFQLRAERRLGFIIEEARKAGLFRQGRQPKKSDAADFSRPTLADAGVDKPTAQRAKDRASISEQAFEAMVTQARERIASGRAKIIEPDRTEDKKRQRETRERVLAGIQCALPQKRYGVIYADPEWRFEPYSRDTGMDRAADNHYPTSATEAICARPVGDIAADDCVLFLWATVPMLPDALKVMDAWGFTYKSHCIWTKDKVGTGYWFRNAHELLLVGTKGNIPAPAMGTQWPSTIEGRVTKHSAKPERFYELIEEYFPNLPKIELNARRARKGWDAWGNEAPVDSAGAPIEHDAETGEITESSSVEGDEIAAPAAESSNVVTQNQNLTDSDLEIPSFLDRRQSASVSPRTSPLDNAGADG